VCSVEGQRRWQLATSTGWPHGPRVGLRRRSPLGASPGPALEAPRAVVPRVLPRRTSREQRWRQSVWPNDDRAPPCTAAFPYRFPALLYEDVLSCYVPRGLLLHPRPWTQLTVCAHRHLASLHWFSALPPRPGGFHADPTMSKRCAREERELYQAFARCRRLASWPYMALSPGAFLGSGIPRQVTALTSWTASDTLSVSANSYAPWPA
jgi:hypothetical protein